MAKSFIKPRLNKLFADSVRGLITDLNKRHKFQVVTETKTTCPNCINDSTTGAGTGKYNGTGPKAFTARTCPVCKNAGHVVATSTQTITANVQLGTLDPSGTWTPSPEGRLDSSHARVKGFAENQALFDNATFFLVDKVRYSRQSKPQSRGLQSLVTCFFYLKLDA